MKQASIQLNSLKFIFAISLVLPFFSERSFAAEAEAPIQLSIKYQRKIEREVEGKIRVELDSPNIGQQKVSKSFYGALVSNFIPLPRPQTVKGLGLGMLRIGGNLYDTFNWENGMMSLGNQLFAKEVALEESLKTMKTYQTEPIVQINMFGFRPEPDNGLLIMRNTADEESAYKFIKHINGELKLGLKNVCLGNEFEQWHETHAEFWKSENPLTADSYIDRFIKFSLKIREAQEEVSGNANDIKIWGPETSGSWYDWQSGNMEKDCEWGDIRGQVNCSYGNGKFDHFLPYFYYRLGLAEKDAALNPKGYKLLDFSTFHYYALFRTKINDVNSIITDSQGMQDVSAMLSATQVFTSDTYVNKYDRSSYRDIPTKFLTRMKQWRDAYYPGAQLALTEFAVDSFVDTYGYHPIVRPLYMADTIGILASEGVAHLTNGFFNAITGNTTPWTLIHEEQKTQLYQMYQLFTNHFLGSILPVTDTFGDKVNAYAVYAPADERNRNAYINVFVVNKSALPKTMAMSFKKRGEELPVVEYELPAWSLSLFKVPTKINAGDLFQVYHYGAREMKVEINEHYKDVDRAH